MNYNNQEKYDEGYVCFMDILGFSEFVKDEAKFLKIYNIFDEIITKKQRVEQDDFIEDYKISICSDSILITLSTAKFTRFLDFDFFAKFICYVRALIMSNIGTEIRATITFGKYFHSGMNNQIFFGPAISRAVALAEKKDKIKDIPLELKNNPAAIIVDRIIYSSLLEEFDAKTCNVVFDRFFKKLQNGYYLINPYIMEYIDLVESQVSYISKEEVATYHHAYLQERLNNPLIGEKYKYCCVLFEPIDNRLIDILYSRRKDLLEPYFSRKSKEEKSVVKYFICDLNDTYRSIAYKYFRGITVVADSLCKVLHKASYVKNIVM